MITLVNYEMGFNDGILSKYARKMKEQLDLMGVEAEISAVPGSGINHHINYLPYKPNGAKNTLMITHIFEGYKFDRVKEAMKTADVGICFSGETKEQLESKGIKNLEVILPAHDELPRKKKKVAVVTNVYSDGCKREHLFYGLLEHLANKEDFDFLVMGKGWIFNCPEFNYEEYKKILQNADYMLYFGLDEGAMSVLDAKQSGLALIAPLSGFHKEIGIDYPFTTQEELNAIFDKLAHNPVENWTWENYVAQHLKIWKRIRI